MYELLTFFFQRSDEFSQKEVFYWALYLSLNPITATQS